MGAATRRDLPLLNFFDFTNDLKSIIQSGYSFRMLSQIQNSVPLDYLLPISNRRLNCSSERVTLSAAAFSIRCSTEDVPGIGSITLDR